MADNEGDLVTLELFFNGSDDDTHTWGEDSWPGTVKMGGRVNLVNSSVDAISSVYDAGRRFSKETGESCTDKVSGKLFSRCEGVPPV